MPTAETKFGISSRSSVDEGGVYGACMISCHMDHPYSDLRVQGIFIFWGRKIVGETLYDIELVYSPITPFGILVNVPYITMYVIL